MNNSKQTIGASSALLLGFFIFLGLATLGWLGAKAAIDVKQYERSVTVKGLSEKEYVADIVIWPIQFSSASNDLKELYQTIENNKTQIKQFLTEQGIENDEISFNAPSITDKLAQQYGNNNRVNFRYTGLQAVTVYSKHIDLVRSAMTNVLQLAEQGIVITRGDYQAQTQYLFSRLNEVKPEMVEEATLKAREVAQKFAKDSNSKLGKIKRARQGQFSITARDQNNPHIKQVRVVSTIEYYLTD